jgi:hypothetical protein
MGGVCCAVVVEQACTVEVNDFGKEDPVNGVKLRLGICMIKVKVYRA